MLLAKPPCLFDFQSPLHRGRLFNDSLVPVLDSLLFSFSPLFIGEDSSTLILKHLDENGLHFQSPLHRGRLFNVSKLDSGPLKLPRFQSPLHRGRLFNTLSPTAAEKVRITFQSPLHRGRLFNNSAP